MRRPKSRRLMIVGILSTFFAIVSCSVAYQLIFHDCLWWECAPKRSFTIFDLNLPREFFPSNAEIHDLRLLRGDNVAIEAASTTNYWDKGIANYIVRRFATEAKAIQHYSFDVQVEFTKQPNESSNYSELVTYQGLNANSSSTQCGYIVNDFRCIYIARYEEFAIFFSGSIGDGEMSKDDFLRAIMFIDGTIGNLLATNSQ